MAIIKKAENINIQVVNDYTSISKVSFEESEQVLIKATKDNMTVSSQKRTILQGFGKTEKKTDVLPLRVLKVDGPFDNGKKGDIMEKSKWYIFKVIQFNREPKPEELKQLKWARQYDDGKIVESTDPTVKGSKNLNFMVKSTNECSKVRIHAFFRTPNKNASVEVKIENTCDAVMIVGSELHEPTYGNKMRFFAQAVRTLLTNKDKWKKVSLIYFNYKNKYNNAEINEVKKALSSYSAKEIDYVPITTVSEMINRINSYKKIKILHFYSHGMPSKITFGLGSIAENMDGAQTFTFSEISKLKKNIFDNEAQVHSYACRTGNAQKDPMQNDFTSYYTIMYFAGKADFSEKFVSRDQALARYNKLKRSFSNVYLYEPGTSPADIYPENSLAQKLAIHLGISVFAFKTRSDYQPTWHGNFKKIEIPDESVEKGWYGAKFWQEGDHALWNSTGAINGVKGGSTPKGLDNKLTEYKPN